MLAACRAPDRAPGSVPPADTSALAAPMSVDTQRTPPADAIRFGRTVTLRGTLDTLKRYGPPGYGENPAADERLTFVVLRLDAPIDVYTGHQDWEKTETDVRDVQLVVHERFGRLTSRVGQRVEVTGTPFHSITGYHHTKVLLDPSDLRPLPSDTAASKP